MKKELAKKCGNIIKQIREEKGLSQKEVAEKLQVHFGYYGRLERGDTTALKVYTVVRLSEIFKTDLLIRIQQNLHSADTD